MLYVGQKVIHVPIYGNWEGWEKGSAGLDHPIKGHIYTVREVYDGRKYGQNCWGVRLYEILGKIHPVFKIECGWNMEEFRPLEERKTDISIFQMILEDTSKEILQ